VDRKTTRKIDGGAILGHDGIKMGEHFGGEGGEGGGGMGRVRRGIRRMRGAELNGGGRTLGEGGKRGK